MIYLRQVATLEKIVLTSLAWLNTKLFLTEVKVAKFQTDLFKSISFEFNSFKVVFKSLKTFKTCFILNSHLIFRCKFENQILVLLKSIVSQI